MTNGILADTITSGPHFDTLNRKCESCEMEKEKETLQLSRKVDNSKQDSQISGDAIDSILLPDTGFPLDPHTRDFMEAGFGHDFRNVWIHTDDTSAE